MKKGSALITVIVVIFALMAIVGVFLYALANGRRISHRYYEGLVALGLAEAGVDYAIWEINFGECDFAASEGWSGINPATKTISGFQDVDNNIYGDIEMKVYDVGSDEASVLAGGVIDSNSGPQVRKQVEVKLKKHKIFAYAILTDNNLGIGGTVDIDSYNSSSGPYGGPNVNDNGDIVTNSAANPGITVSGDASVNGDAATGPGGSVSVTGSADISGSTSDDAEIFIPPVTVPADLEDSASSGPLSLDGHQSLELTTGDYKYDSLTLSSHAVLTLDGDVNLYFTQSPSLTTTAQSQIIVRNGKAKIYFDGDVSLSGQAIFNESTIPANLVFYGTPSVSTISITGGGATYGCFYVPSAEYFSISGNCDIYGSVVGENVTLGGTGGVHFDEALLDDSPTFGYDPYLWQEK